MTERLLNMKPWCEYDVSEPHIICDFCHQVKYLFNYKATKFCLKKVPGSVFENITTPFQYLKCMLGPGWFFFTWNKDLHRFENYLDNPHMHYNIKQADWFLVIHFVNIAL